MNLHERQQFDFFLMTAIERFVERIVQRNAGAENALEKLKTDASGDAIWLADYVDNLFEDFLLKNTAGACFVLSALEKQEIEINEQGKVEQILINAAQKVFAELLKRKTVESLERTAGIGF